MPKSNKDLLETIFSKLEKKKTGGKQKGKQENLETFQLPPKKQPKDKDIKLQQTEDEELAKEKEEEEDKKPFTIDEMIKYMVDKKLEEKMTRKQKGKRIVSEERKVVLREQLKKCRDLSLEKRQEHAKQKQLILKKIKEDVKLELNPKEEQMNKLIPGWKKVIDSYNRNELGKLRACEQASEGIGAHSNELGKQPKEKQQPQQQQQQPPPQQQQQHHLELPPKAEKQDLPKQQQQQQQQPAPKPVKPMLVTFSNRKEKKSFF